MKNAAVSISDSVTLYITKLHIPPERCSHTNGITPPLDENQSLSRTIELNIFMSDRNISNDKKAFTARSKHIFMKSTVAFKKDPTSIVYVCSYVCPSDGCTKKIFN